MKLKLSLFATFLFLLTSCGNTTTPVSPDDLQGGIGIFSVSKNRRVTFSPGNLQYNMATKKWRFAKHQWDIVGLDNSKLGPSYKGWIDLFGWSGKSSYAKFGVSNSTEIENYSGSFLDWGTNKIGPYHPNSWRTLTYKEWTYLVHERKDADLLHKEATVNGVDGLLLFPDSWSTPFGVSMPKGIEDYNTSFDLQDWSILENEGAVFLPAAGFRLEGCINEAGGYWSASQIPFDKYSAVYYDLDRRAYGHKMFRDTGLSVRLVRDVE